MFQEWVSDFGQVILRPSSKTFEEVSQNAREKFSSGVAWLLGTIILDRLIWLADPQFDKSDPVRIAASIVFLLMMTPFFFIFFSYIVNYLYKKLFKRKKEIHEEIYYLSILIFVPFTILTAIFRVWTPIAVWAFWVITSYQILLLILTLRAITHLNYWQAFVTILVSLPLSLFAFICLAAWIPSLMNSTSTLMR